MEIKKLIDWTERVTAEGNGYYVCINGGGITFMKEPLTIVGDYEKIIIPIEKGTELEEFRTMDTQEYENSSFFCIKHNTGYNQENMDIQVAVYDTKFTLYLDNCQDPCVDFYVELNTYDECLEKLEDLRKEEEWFKDFKGGVASIYAGDTTVKNIDL